jgi:RimJ/RimL family protein N-acetyltransferase
MLKKRETTDSHALYDLMKDPHIFPYVRYKAESMEEYMFQIKNLIEAEEQGKLISRTILDEWGTPIGSISLFDIENNAGFLATWIGKPYHGKGYNQPAKEQFFNELFYERGIQTIFMKIRKTNIRSIKAAEKLPYAVKADESRKALLEQINQGQDIYHLYEIPKDLYTLYLLRVLQEEDEERLKEA